MRIAIVGSGISGLSAAWLLNECHDILLYEAEPRLGGHSHTVDVPSPRGEIPVDTGFIVYNEQTYPNLTALFAELDVPTRSSNMSFGVSMDQGRFEYAGSETYGALFAQKRNLFSPIFQRMLFDIVRFKRVARRHLSEDGERDDTTIDHFLTSGRFGKAFTHRYFLPMCAAIWSSSPESMRAFPARSLLRFFDNHGLLNILERPVWRTVVGGSRVYVEKLSQPLQARIRTASPVRRIVRTGDQVSVIDERGGEQSFDAVVLACHADQALRLLATPSMPERQVLGAFRYQTNRAVLHHDPALMPVRRDVWSSWNYLSHADRSGRAAAAVTYWLDHLQGIECDQPIFLSLNPLTTPRSDKVVAEFSYDHPQFDHGALKAQARLPEIQGQDRIWFAGAHWGYGFHEDGLLSGLRVAADLGVTPPWWQKVKALRPSPQHAPFPEPAFRTAAIAAND